MTTEEFIKKVNSLSEEERNGVFAFLAPGGGMVIATDSTSLRSPNSLWLAHMPIYSNSWSFLEKCIIPGRVLKLMSEFADSKYYECEKKYVILNGKPFLLDCSLSTRLFLINDDSLSFAIANINNLADFAYTKEELEQLKSTLPEKLQDAVDMLTVTVSEAKKIMKNDD